MHECADPPPGIARGFGLAATHPRIHLETLRIPHEAIDKTFNPPQGVIGREMLTLLADPQNPARQLPPLWLQSILPASIRRLPPARELV